MEKLKPGTNSYKVPVSLNTGANKFRVKQIDYTTKPRYSRVAKYNLSGAAITYNFNKSTQIIRFSSETMFEIYNFRGLLKTKGKGEQASLSDLEPGDYYLNYDNVTEMIKVK